MQFNVVLIATALLASASLAMSALIIPSSGAGCTGTRGVASNVPTPSCFTLGGGSAKSINYSGVPTEIQFFISGGQHDGCSNGPQLVLGRGFGCATAPAGVNWESVFVS